ncbi:MAG: BBP7 family outer membrane beta-barrel protein [Planctomycetota bacterium]|nr:BBP7 family outer membrane beta-barrel protein [Planctomycetota bacterium]
MIARLNLAVLVLWVAAAASGAEAPLAKVAKELGLPDGASEAQVLQAIQGLKNAAQPQTTATEKIESAVDRALGAKYQKYEVQAPTLGASEKAGQWYGRAEALFLFRYSLDEGSAAPFAIDEDDEDEPFVALDTGDLDHSFKPGMRLTVGYQWSKAVSLELTYFGLHSFDEEGDTSDPDGDLGGTFGLDEDSEGFGDTLGFDAFESQDNFRADLKSSLHSGEFNVRHQISRIGTWVPTVVAGVRYLNIDEELTVSAFDDGDAQADFGVYEVNTQNHLIGLQLGLELTHTFNDWASVTVSGKSGMLANAASGEMTMRDGTDGIIYDADDDEVGLALLAEAGVFGTFRPHKNFDIRIGYNMLVLTGLALGANNYGLAVDQVDGDVVQSKMNLNRNGNLLYHGPSLGFTLRW